MLRGSEALRHPRGTLRAAEEAGVDYGCGCCRHGLRRLLARGAGLRVQPR
jgi:hypothetical protein